jgi:HEAT repeat protein
MNPSTLLRHSLLTGCLTAAAFAQEWTDEQLVTAAKGFQTDSLAARLQQAGALLAERDQMFSALVARIHGDHREYLLKVDRLLEELADERWQVREAAERTLIEIGGRAKTMIQQRKEKPTVLEQGWRCARILDALTAKANDQEDRELKLMRGLVATSLYLSPDPRLLRALRSALGHTDAALVEGAIRALGKLGGDDEADAVKQMVTWKGGVHRLTSVAALARMNCPKALAACRELINSPQLMPQDRIAMLRALHTRDDADAKGLLKELENAADPLVAAAAKMAVQQAKQTTQARFTLPDRSQLDAGFGGFFGESLLVHDGFEGLAVAELAFGDCDVIEFPSHSATPTTGARVFLNQGSLVAGEILAIDAETLRLSSPLFGALALPRAEVQGLALDPSLDRMVGASSEHDRVRLRSGEFVDGTIASSTKDALRLRLKDGSEREVAMPTVAGILFTRPRSQEPDTTIYTRLDLVTGERLIGFVVASSGVQLGVHVPQVGSATIPLTAVMRAELGVGGGALWGFTLVADYSENRIVEVDDQGREVFVLEEIFGAWDAECLDNGNLLITEFSVSRVQEVDRKGKAVWVFEDLKNPYDADRLPNGNTLIADTFGSRVIEVDPQGKIVWSYDKDIRPFDADRLPNGNTLIANVTKDSVIEVSPQGEIVWEATKLPNVHDADRLPNGNTLVTLRNKGTVLELDREGKVVWELTGLSSPSDADRLPNGHTLVAENTMVREFDRRGNEVWKKAMTWAVEVNRY